MVVFPLKSMGIVQGSGFEVGCNFIVYLFDFICVSQIDFDVHLEKDESGRRFISRITEIEALDVTTAYPTNYKDLSDKNDRMAAFMDTMTTFFERRTDRATYKVRNVVEFKEGRYITKDDISQQSLERMLRQMTPEDGLAFKGFIETNWGHQL